MKNGNGQVEPTRLVLLDGKAQKPTLEQAQNIVGGWVEMVTLPNGDQMLVNEEGALHGLPLNAPASTLAGRALVGNVILLKGEARWD